jgi:hypothetical protein
MEDTLKAKDMDTLQALRSNILEVRRKEAMAHHLSNSGEARHKDTEAMVPHLNLEARNKDKADGHLLKGHRKEAFLPSNTTSTDLLQRNPVQATSRAKQHKATLRATPTPFAPR